MKFEKDFDFESANAQFNKEEIDIEFQSKLKLKGINRLLNKSHLQQVLRAVLYINCPGWRTRNNYWVKLYTCVCTQMRGLIKR